jgi:hypothetical protein
MSKFLTPVGDPNRWRYPASVRRDLSSIRTETLISNVAFDAIDHLASKAMRGQSQLCAEGRILASGDPYIGAQMQAFINWAAMAKMEVACGALGRWQRLC